MASEGLEMFKSSSIARKRVEEGIKRPKESIFVFW
jgi:hypothetical protein